MVGTPILSTYRIQFSPYFSFKDCKDIVEFLSKLGVSHVYASPILESVKGSVHGYDQTDFTRIREEIGSESGLRELSSALREKSIGWIQDIVPNHMAMTPENPLIYDILKNGQNSEFAEFFDIDWHDKAFGDGKICLPFLANPLEQELKESRIKIEYGDDFSLSYGPLHIPLNTESYVTILGKDITDLLKHEVGQDYHPGNMARLDNLSRMCDKAGISPSEINEKVDSINSNPETLKKLLSQQYYVLSYWRDSNRKLNYRRFFAVNGLIGIKEELPENFETYHKKLFQLVNEGIADGLRIDHIDGFKMPFEYLKKLRNRVGKTYLVVEKILEMDEELPLEWPVEGTTGYDFLGHVNYLLVDNSSMKELDRVYQTFSGEVPLPEELVRNIKYDQMRTLFSGSVERVAEFIKERISLSDYGRDSTVSGIQRSIMAVLSLMPVYRTYISPTNERKEDMALFGELISKAKLLNPELREDLEILRNFIMEHPGDKGSTDSLMLLQQYMPGVFAKSVEDTLFFSYNSLISLNEVGSMTFYRKPSIDQFHQFCLKKSNCSPVGMNALSSHDTKMSEDIRARVNVLSEMPQLWNSKLNKWRNMNETHRKNPEAKICPSQKEEYYIYQIALGSFPLDGKNLPEFMERLRNHLLKSIREAGENTTWDDPEFDYEDRYMSFVDSILDSERSREYMADFSEFLNIVSFHGALNSLSQKIIQLTAPGVPDTYQGTEVWNFNFVDPDNRRAVNFKGIDKLLAELTSAPARKKTVLDYLESYHDGKIKLFVTWKLLNLRKMHPELFTGGNYVPLKTSGEFSENIVSYLRISGKEKLIVAVPRLTTHFGLNQIPVGKENWSDTCIEIPEYAQSEFRNEITGESVSITSAELQASDLFKSAPFAVLSNADKSDWQQSST